MQVQELMTRPAVTCRSTDPLNTAAQLMWDHDCGAVPVVDDSGSLVGLITDRDICMAAYTQGRRLEEIPAAEAMATRVFSCHRHDSLESAEELMGEKQIRRLPVIDSDRRPIGVLSLNDIARHAATSRTNGRLSADVTRTLAAICEPRQTTRTALTEQFAGARPAASPA
jgi:CBS domain-containing protein